MREGDNGGELATAMARQQAVTPSVLHCKSFVKALHGHHVYVIVYVI